MRAHCHSHAHCRSIPPAQTHSPIANYAQSVLWWSNYSHSIPGNPLAAAPQPPPDKTNALLLATIEDRSSSIAVWLLHSTLTPTGVPASASGGGGGGGGVIRGCTLCKMAAANPRPHQCPRESRDWRGVKKVRHWLLVRPSLVVPWETASRYRYCYRYRYRHSLALQCSYSLAYNWICNAYQAPLGDAIGDNCIIRLQIPHIALIAYSRRLECLQFSQEK